jgi:hypothetical protein
MNNRVSHVSKIQTEIRASKETEETIIDALTVIINTTLRAANPQWDFLLIIAKPPLKDDDKSCMCIGSLYPIEAISVLEAAIDAMERINKGLEQDEDVKH